MKKHKIKGWIQIFLLAASIFAFSYIIHETNFAQRTIVVEKKFSILPKIFRFLIMSIFSEKTLVSALEPSDVDPQTGGVATCVKAKDQSVCQEYPKSECDSACEGSCFPATRDKTPGCKLGTCFDTNRGTCDVGAPEGLCNANQGEWFDDPAGNVPQCQTACCMVGDQARPLLTARECAKIGEETGISTEYKPEVKTEIACLNLAKTQAQGACISNQGERSCRFVTKAECIANSGEFFEGFLCTHPDFNLNYQKQAGAKCFDNNLYWVDSAGNKENIYDANKAKSWNNGKVLAEDQSCQLSIGSDALANQDTCGNCERLLGSVCGDKTIEEKLSDNSIGFVCLDNRCKDSKGNIRENGESWCEYQGAIGLDEGSKRINRSVDTPGSSHYQAVCIDGKVTINSCGDYRNRICIEERKERLTDGKLISSSVCPINTWQLCINYNSEVKTGAERQKSLEERNKKCLENPVCNLKETNVGDGFQFDLCVPKYPPGFDLQKNAEGSQLSCSFASQKCTVFYVKKIFEGWDCVANCECEKAVFTEQMNDLCMSLGDCGASVNYNGDLSQSYKVTGAPKLGNAYLNKISQYSEPVEGQYANVNVTQYINSVGGIEKLGLVEYQDQTPGSLTIGGTVAGLTGTILLFLPTVASYSSVAASGLGTAGLVTGTTPITLTAFSGALAGAAIGFALTSLVIQLTGIGGGLDPAMTWALIATGTVAGGLVGFGVVSFIAGPGFGLLGFGPIGLILLVVVIIIIVVLTLLGIGDTKKRVVEFQCLPWQPQLGGVKCGECGKDGYTCSKYACQSLGQTCRLLNEGTGNETCADISPNDIAGPQIKPWQDVLSSGFKYEEVGNGVKIVSDENEGCVREYQPVWFGIELDEPGQCQYNLEHINSFEEMDNDKGGFFLGSNLFKEQHAQLFIIPDLTSLGAPGFDPTRKIDVNYHVRCIDGNGNGKTSSEYIMNLCVKPGDDINAPRITKREPIKEEVKFNQTELHGTVFTNEPADCKWDFEPTKSYDEMANKMTCANDVVDLSSIYGWQCSYNFPITQDENKFYIKCRDQPWYGVGWEGEGSDTIIPDESKRNTMENYEFNVKRTNTPLIINSAKPSNENFVFGVQPATVNLEAETSGGVDNGRAKCYFFEVKTGNELAHTFETKHTHSLNQIFEGSYEFPIVCEDIIGNRAETKIGFEVKLDLEAPKVTRVFNQGGSLVVITNENSECSFMQDTKKQCRFEFVNGTMMDGNDKRHSTDLEDKNYYIKCKDVWGNTPGECSVIVRGGIL